MKARYHFTQLPPSVNSLWRHTKSGKTYRTNAYQTWLNGEGWNLRAQLPAQPKFSGPVYLTAALRRPSANADLDNRLKGLGDILQSVGAIDNDKHIMGWNCFWTDDLPANVAAEVSIVSGEAVGAKAVRVAA